MAADFGIGLALLIGLTIALEGGFQLGWRSAKKREAPTGGQLGAIQGAVLGLLALLLGFSFAAAGSRFLEKQDLIVQEANAIGTAYLRADMLGEPHRARLREALASYVRHRLEVSSRLRHGISLEDHAKVRDAHQQIWKAASEGVLANLEVDEVVLPPVNDVIDLHSTRIASARKHLPMQVLALLVVSSLLAIFVIGYGCGMAHRRCLAMTFSLVVLVAASLWTTIDLDRPRDGMIQLSDAPLKELDMR